MKKEIRDKLVGWAERYHSADFIAGDPVSFPHRYGEKRDIEISGFLTAFLSFGNRAQILKAAEKLDALMSRAPLEYVLSHRWEKDFPAGEKSSFYRTISHGAMNGIFSALAEIYGAHADMENALLALDSGTPFSRACRVFGLPEKSPQKKLNMFLRWMVRRNSPVDFGIWRAFSPAELLIPLDTHVVRMAHELGLAQTPSYTLNNAKRITAALAEIFPGDPCAGDFALFGYGVAHPRK